jgi:hypothetical protein
MPWNEADMGRITPRLRERMPLLRVESLDDRVLLSVTPAINPPVAPPAVTGSLSAVEATIEQTTPDLPDSMSNVRSDQVALPYSAPQDMASQHQPADFSPVSIDVAGLHLRVHWHDPHDVHDHSATPSSSTTPEIDHTHDHHLDNYERHEAIEYLLSLGAAGHVNVPADGSGEHAAEGGVHAAAAAGIRAEAGEPSRSATSLGLEGGTVMLAFLADAPNGTPNESAPVTPQASVEALPNTPAAPSVTLRVPDEVLGAVAPLSAVGALRTEIEIDLRGLKEQVDNLLDRVAGLAEVAESGDSWRQIASWLLVASAGAAGYAVRLTVTTSRRHTAEEPEVGPRLPFTDDV